VDELTGGRVVGVGIDAVDIQRFRRILERRAGFEARVFALEEREALAQRGDPVPSLAARFAAKEAVMKAMGLGLGAFRMTDVVVLREASGAPSLSLRNQAQVEAERRGVTSWLVSLTHTDDLAQAVVLALAP
jgi:holo-[acyl-carrier protein] synthase